MLQSMLDSLEAGFGLLHECTFPNPAYVPSCNAQTPRDAAIPSLVADDFFSPHFRIALWRQVSTAVMAMPETTINKHCNLLNEPDKVWFAKQWVMPPPAFQSARSKQCGESLLGRFVSRTPDAGHELGSI
jgi:hypothetical protein